MGNSNDAAMRVSTTSNSTSSLLQLNEISSECLKQRLDSEIKEVSFACKHLIVGLKLFADSEIPADQIIALEDDVQVRLSGFVKMLRDIMKLLPSLHEERGALSDGGGAEIQMFIESIKGIADRLRQCVGHQQFTSEIVESIKSTIVLLLQEFATVRKVLLGMIVSLTPGSTPSPVKHIITSSTHDVSSLRSPLAHQQRSQTRTSIRPKSVARVQVATPTPLAQSTPLTMTLFVRCTERMKRMEIYTSMLECEEPLFALSVQISAQLGLEQDIVSVQILDKRHQVYFDLDDVHLLVNGSVLQVVLEGAHKALGTEQQVLESVHSEILSLKQLLLNGSHVAEPSLPASHRPSTETLSGFRSSIRQLRKDHLLQKTAISDTLDAFKVHLTAAHSKIHSQLRMTSEDPYVSTSTTNLKQTFTTVKDLVDQLKADILRGHTPPRQYVSMLIAQLDKVSTDAHKIHRTMITMKPKWKREWEDRLSSVVQSQQSLKTSEKVLDMVEDGVDELKSVIEQCGAVLNVKGNTHSGAGHNGTSDSRKSFKVPKKDCHHEGLSTVMTEMLTIEADSKRRLEALDKNNTLRQRELKLRIDSENRLGEELAAFQFRNSGQLDDLEVRQAQKNRQAISALFASEQQQPV